MKLDMSYRELSANIETLPATWVPALLAAMVRRAMDANVFVPGGLQKFVANAEAEHLKSLREQVIPR